MKTIITILLVSICTVVTAQDKIYVHTATAANTSGYITELNHPDLNGHPNAGIVYVNTWNPNGTIGVNNNNISSLWYDGTHWNIYNDDFTPMVIGASFNVFIAEDPSEVITHISNASNEGTFGSYTTVIDDANFNDNNPGPYAVMCRTYNPNGVYNPHNYGFYYDDILDKRGIYQENGDPIPTNAGFKILINGDAGTTKFTHIATAANSSTISTTIDNSSLNGNPDATFVFSHYWGIYSVDNEVDLDDVLSVWYDSGIGRWNIYTENLANSIPEGMAFDIIVADQEVLGVEEMELETAISMFPNPAKNEVTISSDKEIDHVAVYDLLGRTISSFETNGKRVQLDVSGYAPGNYIIKVNSAKSNQSLKLVKL